MITATTTTTTKTSATTVAGEKAGGGLNVPGKSNKSNVGRGGENNSNDDNNVSNPAQYSKANSSSNSSGEPDLSSKASSTGMIVGTLVSLVIFFAVVGFLFWWHKTGANRNNGGIPYISNAAAAAAALNDRSGVPPATYHNRMYNIDMAPGNIDSPEDFGSGDYAAGNFTAGEESVRGRASTIYSIPMEGGSSGGGSADGADGADELYGGVMYVAALNQDTPEYASAVEAGSTDELYSVVSVKGQSQPAIGTGGSGGGAENHYDMPAPGEKRRGPKKAKKQQPPQQQQQEAPSVLYDVAAHASGSGSVSQSVEYSHLSARGQKESNNVYDLGPQQRGDTRV